MRCSGWSSLAISACSALVLAGPAVAGITIDPAQVQVGGFVDLVVAVPNDHDEYPITHVTIGIPTDFQVAGAEAKAGWTQSRTGPALSWSGGKIAKGQFATFGLRGTAPLNPETIVFNVLLGDKTGKSVTYQARLDVVGHPARDTSARSMARWALVLAVVGGAVALAALLAAAYGWLRAPP
jgi:uncharacterized protein YcnI